MHPLQLPGGHYFTIPAQCCTVHPTRCWATWGAETPTVSSGSSPAQGWLGMGLKSSTQSGPASETRPLGLLGEPVVCWLQSLQWQDPAWCCWSHKCEPSHTSGGWFMAEGRYDQLPLQLREAGEACGDGFPVSSNMVNDPSAWKRLCGEASAKERVTVPTQISWYMQECLLRIVTTPLRVALWFLCLLGVRDAQALLLPLAKTSPAGSSHSLNSTRQVRNYPGQIFGSLNTFGRIQHWRAVTQLWIWEQMQNKWGEHNRKSKMPFLLQLLSVLTSLNSLVFKWDIIVQSLACLLFRIFQWLLNSHSWDLAEHSYSSHWHSKVIKTVKLYFNVRFILQSNTLFFTYTLCVYSNE